MGYDSVFFLLNRKGSNVIPFRPRSPLDKRDPLRYDDSGSNVIQFPARNIPELDLVQEDELEQEEVVDTPPATPHARDRGPLAFNEAYQKSDLHGVNWILATNPKWDGYFGEESTYSRDYIVMWGMKGDRHCISYLIQLSTTGLMYDSFDKTYIKTSWEQPPGGKMTKEFLLKSIKAAMLNMDHLMKSERKDFNLHKYDNKVVVLQGFENKFTKLTDGLFDSISKMKLVNLDTALIQLGWDIKVPARKTPKKDVIRVKLGYDEKNLASMKEQVKVLINDDPVISMEINNIKIYPYLRYGYKTLNRMDDRARRPLMNLLIECAVSNGLLDLATYLGKKKQEFESDPV